MLLFVANVFSRRLEVMFVMCVGTEFPTVGIITKSSKYARLVMCMCASECYSMNVCMNVYYVFRFFQNNIVWLITSKSRAGDYPNIIEVCRKSGSMF